MSRHNLTPETATSTIRHHIVPFCFLVPQMFTDKICSGNIYENDTHTLYVRRRPVTVNENDTWYILYTCRHEILRLTQSYRASPGNIHSGFEGVNAMRCPGGEQLLAASYSLRPKAFKSSFFLLQDNYREFVSSVFGTSAAKCVFIRRAVGDRHMLSTGV